MAAGQLRPGRAFPGASAKFGSGKPARAVDGTGEMPQTETNAPALGAALPWGLPAPRRGRGVHAHRYRRVPTISR